MVRRSSPEIDSMRSTAISLRPYSLASDMIATALPRSGSKQVDRLDLTFFPEPEVLGEDTGFPPSLLGGEGVNVADEAIDQMIDRGLLMVGADLVLGVAPQVIHRAQFRAALGQPDQTDLQFPRQPDRAVCRMAGIPVQQQPHRPSAVMVVDAAEERLEILSPLLGSREQQPMAGPH